jgi:hypothetical protein
MRTVTTNPTESNDDHERICNLTLPLGPEELRVACELLG